MIGDRRIKIDVMRDIKRGVRIDIARDVMLV